MRRLLSRIKCFNLWSKSRGTVEEAVKKAVKEVVEEAVGEAVDRVRGKVFCTVVL